nr:hypothetical protein [Acetobacter malorum]
MRNRYESIDLFRCMVTAFLAQGFGNSPVMPTSDQFVPKSDFFKPGDFLHPHPGEPAFQNMILLPLWQDQMAVGASLLLVNNKSEMFRVVMEFFTQTTGKG